MESEQIKTLAKLISDEIKSQPPFEKKIMNASEAAAYLKCSRPYLINQLQHRTDFPRPIRFEIKGKPKWFAHELEKWAQKNKL